MSLVKNSIAKIPMAALLLVGGLSLSACATEKYVDEHIAAVNMRIDGVDAKANEGIQRADAAMAAAQQANSAAQGAMSAAQAANASAQNANSRIDGLSTRVDALEAKHRRPRG